MLLPSIRSLKTGSLLLAALAASVLPALAGETTVTASSKDKNPVIEQPKREPRLYMNLLGGGEFDTGYTDFITNGVGAYAYPLLPGVPAIIPGVPTVALPAVVQARDFNETHSTAVINGRLELGYKVLPYLSVFLGGTYSHADGNHRANVGFVADPGGVVGPRGGIYDLYAGVGQYQAFSGIAGIKLNTPRTILDLLHLPRAIKPYLVLSAGGKYIDDQYIRFFGDTVSPVLAATTYSGRVNLYDASWVLTTEAQLGYELQLTRNFSINFENGYGYDTKPERGTLPGYFSGTNRGGDRFYSTLSLGAKLTF